MKFLLRYDSPDLVFKDVKLRQQGDPTYLTVIDFHNIVYQLVSAPDYVAAKYFLAGLAREYKPTGSNPDGYDFDSKVLLKVLEKA